MLPGVAGRGVVVDCRSSTYAAAWAPQGPLAERWVQVRVPGATHMAKHTRGLVARQLCGVGRDARRRGASSPRCSRSASRSTLDAAAPARAALGPRRTAARARRGVTAPSCATSPTRVGPVLVFLVAITVVAEIADTAGVFDVAGHWAARPAGTARRCCGCCWSLVAVACTIVLSLDTTAVLLTPVAWPWRRQIGISRRPFAMTTVWLADTASMLLPVSNLTNLLALHQFEALGRRARRATCGSPGCRRWSPSWSRSPCWR